MTRREALLSAGLVGLVVLVVRIAAAGLVVFPKPEDTAYYVMVARNLLEGRGLVSDAIWSYQTPPLVIPRPAFEVWLPLPTFLAAIPMALAGPTFRAAQVVPVVAGALVAVLAWRLAADVAEELGLPAGRRRTLALGAGLTAAVSLPLVLHGVLPDSTMPFTALALGACALTTRLVRRAGPGAAVDLPLIGLGVLFGLGALTRNEIVWYGLAWLALVAGIPGLARRERLRLAAVPAVVGLAILGPWLVRNALTFGTPLPSQTIANALSVTGYDIFAYQDPPTLERYLAQGPARLVEARVEGTGHNLLNVLLLPGVPVAAIGLVGLPLVVRSAALRPLLIGGGLTFLVTSLVFPVATTWGTFLHAAGPVHVLLIVAALVALDRLIARAGAVRGWTRPVAWLGPALTVTASAALTAVMMPAFGGQSRDTERFYRALGESLAAAGMALPTLGPVVTDFPIWLADAHRVPALALPDEPPASVLALARAFPGTRTLVLTGERGRWPRILDGSPDAACFEPVPLPLPGDPALARALQGARVYRLTCR
ncbi:MAG TPA: hypothetical protein VNJ28_01250 [Candidatus Limnocylindrales bacterium]|nr:hypothetical protein [Candidatus Limnocylindrales bacterium]